MTYNEALNDGCHKKLVDDLIDRFNYWNNDNATPDDIEFHYCRSYYDGAIELVARRIQ